MTRQAMPRTSQEFAVQSQKSAKRRQEAMLPGNERVPPEKDTPVDHHLGKAEEIEIGPPPEDLAGEACRKPS